MLGLETQVEIGVQANAVTPNTTARKALNVYKITGGQSEDMPDDNILAGGFDNSYDPTEPAPGLNDHRVTVEGPVCIAQLPFWLAAFFGPAATTGAATDYTHAFDTGGTPPYVTLQHKLAANDFRRHIGLVGEEFSIDLSSDREGFGKFSMSFVGLEELVQTAALAGAVTAAPALDRPAESLVSVIYNGVAGGQIIGGKLTYKRKLKRLRAADATGKPYGVEVDGRSSFDGSVRVRYGSQAMLADAMARTERTLALELKRTATRGVRLDVAHMRVARTPTPVEGPDGIEFDLPFKGWQTAADPALLLKVLSAAPTIVL